MSWRNKETDDFSKTSTTKTAKNHRDSQFVRHMLPPRGLCYSLCYSHVFAGRCWFLFFMTFTRTSSWASKSWVAQMRTILPKRLLEEWEQLPENWKILEWMKDSLKEINEDEHVHPRILSRLRSTDFTSREDTLIKTEEDLEKRLQSIMPMAFTSTPEKTCVIVWRAVVQDVSFHARSVEQRSVVIDAGMKGSGCIIKLLNKIHLRNQKSWELQDSRDPKPRIISLSVKC